MAEEPNQFSNVHNLPSQYVDVFQISIPPPSFYRSEQVPSECALEVVVDNNVERTVDPIAALRYECNGCGRTFETESELLQHSDKREYKCDLCEKHFKENQALKKHRRIHTGNINSS